jgi:hypothetical protein
MDLIKKILILKASKTSSLTVKLNYFGPYFPHFQTGYTLRYIRNDTELRQSLTSLIRRNRFIFERPFVTSWSRYSRLLCNPMVHCYINKSPPLVPMQSRLNPITILILYFFKTLSNIKPPSTHGSSKCFLTFRFPD